MPRYNENIKKSRTYQNRTYQKNEILPQEIAFYRSKIIKGL